MYWRFVFTIVLMMLAAASAAAQRQSTPNFRIVGYFASWSIFDREYFVTDIPADKLTHINYAFANISDEGEIVLGDEWADTQFPYPDDDQDSPDLKGNFRQLQLLKAAHPNLQILIAVGGYTWSGKFSDVALTPESRQKFAQSGVEFILEYGFDGIDIDWEYPTGGGLEGNIVRPEDAHNFALLLAEIRTQLDAQGEKDGRHYLLTIAAAADTRAYAALDWAQIHPSLDWINVMTYDMSGEWSAVTGFNAPLFGSADDSPEDGNTDRTLRALLTLGIPPENLVMGVPFYGRGWSGVGAENNGLHQPFERTANGTWEQGFFDYSDLASRYVGTFERFWDEGAQVPWLYNAEKATMISYDDPESIGLKASYVRDNHLGGVMFWELSQDDSSAALLTTIFETLNAP